MTVPFFWRTLPMLFPAVAANVKRIDSHISDLSLSLSLAQMYPNFCFLNKQYISLIINCLVRFRLVLAEVWSYQIFICFVGGGGHCWCGLVLHQQSIEWTWWPPLIISVWSDYWFVICDFLSMIFLPLISFLFIFYLVLTSPY